MANQVAFMETQSQCFASHEHLGRRLENGRPEYAISPIETCPTGGLRAINFFEIDKVAGNVSDATAMVQLFLRASAAAAAAAFFAFSKEIGAAHRGMAFVVRPSKANATQITAMVIERSFITIMVLLLKLSDVLNPLIKLHNFVTNAEP